MLKYTILFNKKILKKNYFNLFRFFMVKLL